MSISSLVTWDGHTAGSLAHRCAVPHLELLGETDSTQDIAHELAESGAPMGTVVVADGQRAGRGRHGRSWSSKPGQGVWCTIVERPLDAKALDVLSIRVGLRVAESLDEFAPARVGVKWPNDLMIRDEKLGGILTEARWSGATLGWVAIGVGVNVMMPEDVKNAVGLRDGVQRADVFAAIVRAVRSAAAASEHLSNDEVSRLRTRDVLTGRRIAAPAAGTVRGIHPSGALLVETATSVEQHRTGTIRFVEDS
jgi:BirA family biotin operon repressor/biotin-[acetyl-CoA-carboxylase] ligase